MNPKIDKKRPEHLQGDRLVTAVTAAAILLILLAVVLFLAVIVAQVWTALS